MSTVSLVISSENDPGELTDFAQQFQPGAIATSNKSGTSRVSVIVNKSEIPKVKKLASSEGFYCCSFTEI